MKDAIQAKIGGLRERVMDRVLRTDPFIAEKHRADKPLYAALVPDEIFKGSHFERRFVTPFGGVWEDLAVTAAQYGLGSDQRGVMISGTVKQDRLRRIAKVLNDLEHTARGIERVRPDWDKELAYILEGGGEDIPVQVICDLFVTDTEKNLKYAFELKAPLPNSDQTKVSKEKILKLHAMEPCQVNGAYYALPYNPYGKRENYTWSFPARWFNMKEDEAVLIGDEFWEKIGGVGTYQAFIEAVNEIGKEYKERIYREFLGIEPPPGSESVGLL
ncbi:TdeIII family type II restriction endonuclease [Candidatus Methylobacter favarea]|nr:TdeIII family type II restriction endonuclease [Candidatus Methylobacter favarea]